MLDFPFPTFKLFTIVNSFLSWTYIYCYYYYYYYYYHYYYYYCLYYHSLCWCSFCESAGRKPCTQSVSHSSQSFCSYTEHLSEDSCRSQDLSDTFLMFSTIPFFTVPSAPITTGITTVFVC